MQTSVNLAVFDLDHTLIGVDTAFEWNRFVAEQGLVTGDEHHRQRLAFDRDYHLGVLDALAYQRFTMALLPQLEPQQLVALRSQFFEQCILPSVRPNSVACVQQHRERGDMTLLISASNLFLTDPVADYFGVAENLSTQPQQLDGRFSGEVEGVVCLGQGKCTRLQQWLVEQAIAKAQITFYSDSHNDLPLLYLADSPIAVDPDAKLAAEAVKLGWPIISLS